MAARRAFEAVARVVAPESLAVERRVYGGDWRLSARAASVRPGDLILVRTPGTFYGAFRMAAKHVYDHVAIVLEHGLVLHIGPPTLRLLPVELLLSPRRSPLVLRPAMEDDERVQLVDALLELVGEKYDSIRVYAFVARLGLGKWVGYTLPLGDGQASLGTRREVFICTDVILFRMLLHWRALRAHVTAHGPPSDYSRFGSWSINDLLEMHKADPRLFSAVALPPPHKSLAEHDAQHHAPPPTYTLDSARKAAWESLARQFGIGEREAAEQGVSLGRRVVRAIEKAASQAGPEVSKLIEAVTAAYDSLPTPALILVNLLLLRLARKYHLVGVLMRHRGALARLAGVGGLLWNVYGVLQTGRAVVSATERAKDDTPARRGLSSAISELASASADFRRDVEKAAAQVSQLVATRRAPVMDATAAKL